MKIIVKLGLAFCLLVTFSSCDKLLPVDYNKAGRALMVLMRQDDSLTISDYKKSLSEMGMSSKDFFVVLKMDSSVSQIVQLLSLDMINTKAKEMGVTVKNLQRALEK
jgi:hypothetical protein